MPTPEAKFSIGQTVRHVLFDYRGVIYDVDPCFLGTDQWYEEVAKSRPPKDQPWYRVLVDGAQHETYVAERNLTADLTGAEIVHPGIPALFSGFSNGSYQLRRRVV